MEKLLVNIEPGSSILGTYRDQSYKLESAFAEFIDNSTQSFFTHREELLNVGQRNCKIVIEIFPDYIRITDNAFGMDEGDFRRALKLNSPPSDTSGRCEKGMGLKTSATCLGSLWSVKTTQMNSKKEYFCQIDVNVVAQESPESVEATVNECDETLHYTIIEIRELNKKITENKIHKLSKMLAEMYSRDLQNGDLILIVNKEPVKFETPVLRINLETGSEYLEFFKRTFVLGDKTYCFEGWVGIRQVGDTEFSGFTLFRKGRAIKMHYRPTQLLGKPNLYPYQRIVGEIELLGDNWKPSYTKDELMWEGELEERFISELKSVAGQMISLSSTLRKEEKPVSDERKRSISAKVKKSFQTDDDQGIVISGNLEFEKTIEVSENNDGQQASLVDKVLVETTINEEIVDPIKITIQGTTYTFFFSWINNNHDDGVKLNIKDQLKNEYTLTVNYGLPYFGECSKSQKELELIQKMAITIASSIVISKKNGDRDAYRTLSIFNSILKAAK